MSRSDPMLPEPGFSLIVGAYAVLTTIAGKPAYKENIYLLIE
jgi:hypothetical protein